MLLPDFFHIGDLQLNQLSSSLGCWATAVEEMKLCTASAELCCTHHAL